MPTINTLCAHIFAPGSLCAVTGHPLKQISSRHLLEMHDMRICIKAASKRYSVPLRPARELSIATQILTNGDRV